MNNPFVPASAMLRRKALQLVAGSPDDFNGDLVAGSSELALHPVGLPERQLAAARTDDDVHNAGVRSQKSGV
jgi:hypothetical protein